MNVTRICTIFRTKRAPLTHMLPRPILTNKTLTTMIHSPRIGINRLIRHRHHIDRIHMNMRRNVRSPHFSLLHLRFSRLHRLLQPRNFRTKIFRVRNGKRHGILTLRYGLRLYRLLYNVRNHSNFNMMMHTRQRSYLRATPMVFLGNQISMSTTMYHTNQSHPRRRAVRFTTSLSFLPIRVPLPTKGIWGLRFRVSSP